MSRMRIARLTCPRLLIQSKVTCRRDLKKEDERVPRKCGVLRIAGSGVTNVAIPPALLGLGVDS
jgi:hypothetical protein